MFFLMKYYFPKCFLFLMFAFQLFHYGKADLPVHCLAAKIEGVWLVNMGDNSSDRDIKCGHKRPDQNLDHYETEPDKIFKKRYETIVKLERPNSVFSIDNKKEIGKWTMVYDEGFEFQIADQIFFAFSKYEKMGKFSASNTDTEETPGYKNACEKTFVGWYHNSKTNENWGCFTAEQISEEKLKVYNKKAIDYDHIFKYPRIPLNQNKHSALTNLMNKQKPLIMNKENNGEDVFSLMNELSIKPPQQNTLDNKKFIENGPIKISPPPSMSDNSYVDFIKSLAWDSNNPSASSYSNIPHLDIYFLNTMNGGTNGDNSDPSAGNFLEIDAGTKSFRPDHEYVNKVNNPQSGYLWKAKVYDEFTGKSYSQMRNLLGNVNYLKQLPNLNRNAATSGSDFLELEIKVKLS
jgi:hypothetical protein